MRKIQVALARQYATPDNLAKIAEICPAKIAVFSVGERYPLVRKLRGVLCRILPDTAYQPVSAYIDRFAEKQILTWTTPITQTSDINTVLWKYGAIRRKPEKSEFVDKMLSSEELSNLLLENEVLLGRSELKHEKAL